MATLRMTGLDEVLRDQIFREDRDLRVPLKSSLFLLQKYLATYPLRRRSGYRRTGDLGRSWTIRVVGPQHGKIGNNMPYAHLYRSVRSRRVSTEGIGIP